MNGRGKHSSLGCLAARCSTAAAPGSLGGCPTWPSPSRTRTRSTNLLPGYESKAPGAVLKKRSVTVTGLGIPLPVKAFQLQSRSTDAKDRPMTVISTVIVPLTPYLGQRPLLSYQPATDSLGDQCNPSYTLRTGLEKEIPLLALGLAKGWAVVVTDYQGPRDAYGAGRMEGHAVLDGIRATLASPEAGLSASDEGRHLGLLRWRSGDRVGGGTAAVVRARTEHRRSRLRWYAG